MAPFTLNKTERLKKRADIDNLFVQRNQVSKYPLKCYWAIAKREQNESAVLFSVSVPKRIFKKAVDRNLIKRRTREAYRLNNKALKDKISEKDQLHLLMVYQKNEIANFKEIESAVIVILSRLGT